MTDEQLKAEIRTALNLGSLSKGLGEDFPYLERFEGICKEYAAAQDAEIRNLKSYIASLESDNANHSMNLDHLDGEVSRLKAEIKRLRESLKEIAKIQMTFYQEGDFERKAKQFVNLANYRREIAEKALLSPAPEKPEKKPAPETIRLSSSQQFRIQEVRNAYLWIRANNQTIPDDTLDLMKNAAIEAISTESI